MRDAERRNLSRLSVQGDQEAWEQLWQDAMRLSRADLMYEALRVCPNTPSTVHYFKAWLVKEQERVRKPNKLWDLAADLTFNQNQGASAP